MCKILFVLRSMMPYEPYFAECPGLSALPSPPIVRGESRDAHSAKSCSCLCFQTDITADLRNSD